MLGRMTGPKTIFAILMIVAGSSSSAPAAEDFGRLPPLELTPTDLTNCELGEEVLAKGNALAAGLLIEECLTQPVIPETRAKYLGLKGSADLQLALFDLALRDFEGALGIEPKNAQFLTGKGQSLLGLTRSAEAVDAFRSALALEPTHVEALMGLGEAYLLEGKTPLANAFLAKAVEAAPHNRAARLARGKAWVQQGEYALAETDFSAVIADTPQTFEAHYLRGQTRMALKDYEGALADFDAAKALDDDREDVRLDRVLALAQLRRTSDAQLELNEVIDMAPNNVKALMMRGRLYLALKDKDKAKADFVQAVTIDPNGPYTDEAMAELHELNRMDWSDYLED
ncbi:MAG: tetratricopeptide repeat protein [Alphaproteobacteria bacterium]|nr:MAG: tetratricopeptide repeat protein [Alphaproteobacteria bacterium]